MKPISAVIFDMDGTLVDSESVSRRAWAMAASDYGFEIPDALAHSFIGRNASSVHALLVDHLGGGAATEETVDKAFLARHGYFDELAAKELKLMKGAREALEALADMGLPLALATSTARAKAISRLGMFGLEDAFTSMTCGDEIENSKPAPDIFLLAAERMGVEPACCAVIEDSHNGVRAGHAAGMQVFMIPDLVAPTEEIEGMCTAVLDSLYELPAAIAAVNG